MNGRTAAFLLMAATLLVIALTTGTAVYYLMAAMLFMMALVGFLNALITLITLQMTLTAQKKSAERGETVGVRLMLKRRTLLPPGSIELEVSAPDEGRDTGRMVVASAPIKGREYRYAIHCAGRVVRRTDACVHGLSRDAKCRFLDRYSFRARCKAIFI